MHARLIALAAVAILISAPGASTAAAQSTGYPSYPGAGYAGRGYGYSTYSYPGYGNAGYSYSGYGYPGYVAGSGCPAYSGGYPVQVFDAGPLGYAGYPSCPTGYPYGGYPSGYPYSYGAPGFGTGYPYDYGYPSFNPGYPIATPPSSPGGSTGRVCIMIYPPPPGC
jgi:hypothetical protein